MFRQLVNLARYRHRRPSLSLSHSVTPTNTLYSSISLFDSQISFYSWPSTYLRLPLTFLNNFLRYFSLFFRLSRIFVHSVSETHSVLFKM